MREMAAINDAEFLGMLIVAIGALVSFITPILKLNSSITRLNLLLENLTRDHEQTVLKVNSHDDKIQSLEVKITDHEARIQGLERE